MKRSFLTIALLFLSLQANAKTDPLKKVAAELGDGISRYKGARVAVLAAPFHDQRRSDEPFAISERLTAYLVMDKRLSVLERQHTIQLLSEMHLSETGLLNSNATQRLGKALGADVIVTGTLIDLGRGKIDVNMRGLLAESGRIIATSHVMLDLTHMNRFTTSDPLRSLSKRLKDMLNIKVLPSVAVLNFTYAKGRMSTGSHLVSERLSTYLVKDGFTVIERRLLHKILEEQRMWETGLVDAASLKKRGAFLDTETVVAGTLDDVTETATHVIARLIRLDTNAILASASAVIPRLWEDLPRRPRPNQAQIPVPGVNISSLFTEKKSTAKKAPSRYSLSTLDVSKNAKRYRPAVVPIYRALTQQEFHGGFTQ